MSFLIRNLSGGPLSIGDLSISIDTGADFDLTAEPPQEVAQSATDGDLFSLVNAGQVVALDPADGVTALSLLNSLRVLQQANAPHYSIEWFNPTETIRTFFGYDIGGTGAPKIERDDAGGTLIFMPNAVNPQIIAGSDSASTAAFFIDCDNNGILNLNALHTGAVRLGEGGLLIENQGAGGDFGLINNSAAAAFTWTLPAGNPGSTQALTVSPTGIMGYETIIAGDLAGVTAGRNIGDGTQALTSGVYTTLTFPTTNFENDAAVVSHDPITNNSRITFSGGGTYLVFYSLTADPTTTATDFDARVIANGVATAVAGSTRQIQEDGEETDFTNVFIYQAAPGDYLELQVQVNQTGAVIQETSSFGALKMQGAKGDKGDTGSGSTITLEQDDVTVPGGPHDTINFEGLTVTNEGGGKATVSVPPSAFAFVEDLGVSTTTSTTFQTKISWDLSALAEITAGTYEMVVSYGWNHDATDSDFEARVQFDGVNFGEIHKQEPKDSAGTFGSTATSQRYYTTRRRFPTLTGSETITLQWRTDDGNDESSIWEASISLRRVA